MWSDLEAQPVMWILSPPFKRGVVLASQQPPCVSLMKHSIWTLGCFMALSGGGNIGGEEEEKKEEAG